MPLPICGPIQNAMCSMLVGELDKGLDFLNRAKRFLNPKLDVIKVDLGKYSIDLSKLEEIKNKIPDFEVPDFSVDCLSMLSGFIENCPYLNQHSLMKDVAGLTNTLDKWMKLDFINDLKSQFLDPITGLEIPELSIALNLSLSVDICIDLKLDRLIPDMSDLANCLDAFCGNKDISSRMTQMNQLMSDMSLSTSGTLDVGGVLSASGISAEEATAFNSVVTTMGEKKSSISQAVAAGVETARTQTIPPSPEKFFTGDFEFECVIAGANLTVNEIVCTSTSSSVVTMKGLLSPCAICEVEMTGILALEIEFNSLIYVNSYVPNSTLTVIEAGPISLTTEINITTSIIGDLNIT